MQWFRCYSDALADKKLQRVARSTGLSQMQVLGMWTALLCLACDSDSHGQLLLADNIPLTIEDVSETFHETFHETEVMFQAFQAAGLLTFVNKIYAVQNWDKRQYQSDLSTNRVKKHREMKQNETFLKRFRNGPDTDTDTDTEKEKPRAHEADHATDADHAAVACKLPLCKYFHDLTLRSPTPKDHELEDEIHKLPNYNEEVVKAAMRDCLARKKAAEPGFCPNGIAYFKPAILEALNPTNEVKRRVEKRHRIDGK
jgi:hypothetical protein